MGKARFLSAVGLPSADGDAADDMPMMMTMMTVTLVIKKTRG